MCNKFLLWNIFKNFPGKCAYVYVTWKGMCVWPCFCPSRSLFGTDNQLKSWCQNMTKSGKWWCRNTVGSDKPLLWCRFLVARNLRQPPRVATVWNRIKTIRKLLLATRWLNACHKTPLFLLQYTLYTTQYNSKPPESYGPNSGIKTQFILKKRIAILWKLVAVASIQFSHASSEQRYS